MKLDRSIGSIVSRRVAALAVTLLTIGFWLTILTYPGFFFFDPLQTVDPVFRVEQLLSTCGWILASIFPMLFSWLTLINNRSTERLYLVSVLLWPASVLIIQITMLVQGFGFYAYLGSYPILAFSDLFAPVFLVSISGLVFKRQS